MLKIPRWVDWVVPLLMLRWSVALAIWSRGVTTDVRIPADAPEHLKLRVESLEQRVEAFERADEPRQR